MSQSRPLPEGGSVRPITRWGTPVMHRELAEVTSFDDELAELVRDMVATMRAARGVGLAANQVGVDLKVFVFECPDADNTQVTGVVCNPVLLLPEGKDRQLEDEDEGCLSLPGAFTTCARPDQARVTGVDEHGEPLPEDTRVATDKPVNARMVIINDELRATEHRQRIKEGVKFFVREGRKIVAEGVVTRIVDLFND